MPLRRPRKAAVRGLLLACSATTAAAAVLGTGLLPASGAVSSTGRTAAAVADTTPPSTPEGLTPRSVYVNGAVGLTWTPSADDVAVTGYEVYAWSYSATTGTPFSRVQASVTASGTEVGAIVTGLTPGRDYLFYVVAVDAAGNRSVPSLLVRARAMVEPPVPSPSPSAGVTLHAPYDLRVYAGPAPGYVGMQWASEDSGGTVTWLVFRRSSSEWSYAGYSTLPRTMASIGSESSYTFQVVASDTTTGNLSGTSNAATYVVPSSSPSPSPSVTPTETPKPVTCAVTYTAKSWQTGFTTDITIKNTGSAPIDGWRLAFGFPLTTQHLTSGWSATWAQSGTDVTATNLAWNKTINPGQSVRIGFNGTHSGSNPSPTAFTLNGNACVSG